jgi:hypothetical protein
LKKKKLFLTSLKVFININYNHFYFVHEFLILIGKIHCTSDIWTSSPQDSYLSVTAHFIDKSLNSKSFLLEQVPVPQPHDHVSVMKTLDVMFCKYEIQTKVESITTDNGSNMVKGIKNLVKKYKKDYKISLVHLRCANHILHLACTAFLKIDTVSHCILL